LGTVAPNKKNWILLIISIFQQPVKPKSRTKLMQNKNFYLLVTIIIQQNILQFLFSAYLFKPFPAEIQENAFLFLRTYASRTAPKSRDTCCNKKLSTRTAGWSSPLGRNVHYELHNRNTTDKRAWLHSRTYVKSVVSQNRPRGRVQV